MLALSPQLHFHVCITSHQKRMQTTLAAMYISLTSSYGDIQSISYDFSICCLARHQYSLLERFLSHSSGYPILKNILAQPKR